MEAIPASGFPKLPKQQKQIHRLLQKSRSFLVLGQAHPIAKHRRARADIDLRDATDLLLAHARSLNDVRPFLSQDFIAHRLQPARLLADEIMADDLFTLHLAFEHDLHHAFEQGEVAADPDVNELAGDLRRAEGCHLDDVLRLRETDESALRHRIDGHDRSAAFPCLDQIGHHARRVGTGILSNDKDRVGVLEILHHHRALPDAYGRRQAAASRFVTHVRAVRKIVGAELPHEIEYRKATPLGVRPDV